jgi:hypothetical protein
VVVTVGLTFTLVPEPAEGPPQLPEYHCQEAPVPSDPPVKESVVDCPTQIVDIAAEAAVGATELLLSVTVTDAQAVVLHGPMARTK